MKSVRYRNLVADLERCTELLEADIEGLRSLSKAEWQAVTRALELFQETLDNVSCIGDIYDFIDYVETNGEEEE